MCVALRVAVARVLFTNQRSVRSRREAKQTRGIAGPTAALIGGSAGPSETHGERCNVNDDGQATVTAMRQFGWAGKGRQDTSRRGNSRNAA